METFFRSTKFSGGYDSPIERVASLYVNAATRIFSILPATNPTTRARPPILHFQRIYREQERVESIKDDLATCTRDNLCQPSCVQSMIRSRPPIVPATSNFEGDTQAITCAMRMPRVRRVQVMVSSLYRLLEVGCRAFANLKGGHSNSARGYEPFTDDGNHEDVAPTTGSVDASTLPNSRSPCLHGHPASAAAMVLANSTPRTNGQQGCI